MSLIGELLVAISKETSSQMCSLGVTVSATRAVQYEKRSIQGSKTLHARRQNMNTGPYPHRCQRRRSSSLHCHPLFQGIFVEILAGADRIANVERLACSLKQITYGDHVLGTLRFLQALLKRSVWMSQATMGMRFKRQPALEGWTLLKCCLTRVPMSILKVGSMGTRFKRQPTLENKTLLKFCLTRAPMSRGKRKTKQENMEMDSPRPIR